MSGPSHHERSIAGERVLVWDEMIRLGDSIREEPVLSDALAVGLYLMVRAPKPVAVGTFPLLIREWYLGLASVDFSQSQPQEAGPTESCVGGLGFNCTLIMQSLGGCWRPWERLAREHAEGARTARESGHSTFGPEPLPAILALGPSASNCDSMGFRLPNLGVDGIFYKDGAGDTYFIDHLRNVFEWGGFPFCRWYSQRRRRHFLSARPDVEKVLPILKEGLLPL